MGFSLAAGGFIYPESYAAWKDNIYFFVFSSRKTIVKKTLMFLLDLSVTENEDVLAISS